MEWFLQQLTAAPNWVQIVITALITLGILVALPDQWTEKVMSQDHLGWVMIGIGVIVATVGFLLPFWGALTEAVAVLWSKGSVSMVLAALIGVGLVIGGIIFWRRNNP